eukprot:SAG22_NODE_6103_length_898_cov_1.068836_1_plen_133_part_00
MWALDVHIEDFMATMKYPFTRELPEAFFGVMAAGLDGPLAEDYRGYIRHEVKPALDRIKDILHAHYAAIEAPSLDWLRARETAGRSWCRRRGTGRAHAIQRTTACLPAPGSASRSSRRPTAAAAVLRLQPRR